MAAHGPSPDPPNLVPLADGYADLARHAIVRGGVRAAMSTREAELLGYLARAGRSVGRDELLDRVWRYRSSHPTRAVDMCVRRLRAKIERDPTAPEHVITVLGEGYRFIAPPVDRRPARRCPTGPAPLTSFHGRGAALAEVRHALGDARLVTVLGGPGLGKTRLARELCRDWPTRAVFCDLAGTTDADGLGACVATALDTPIGADPAERVGQAIAAAGPILVVLDNFEQLVDAAPSVTRWLERAPDARILVTSRARLGVGGERLVALAPLERPAAVDLFVERAAAVGATGLDRRLAERVVGRLECVPLALELAAGRLRTLSLAQLAERLDSHLRALVSSGREADRHATMRAAIAWSWELLAPHERAMLAALSVFRSGFELEAVEEIVGAAEPWWPDEVVGSLVDQSLVRVGDERLHLFECVREFAAENLPPADALALRERHLRYFADAAERILAVLPLAEALRRLEALRPELLSAWETASDADSRGRVAIVLGELLARRGPQATFVRVIEQTLASPMSAEPTARLRVIAGHYALFARQFGTARARLLEAEPLLATASPAAVGDALDLRSRLLAADGDLDGAAGAMREARARFEAAGMHGRAAWVAMHVALLPERARTAEGDADRDAVGRALDDAERALAGVHDDVGLRLVDACRARWALSAGDRDRALYWLQRAGWSAQPVAGDPPGTMEAAVIAVVEEALGHYAPALAAARHRAEARRAYAPPARQASAGLRVAQFLAVLGRTGEAVEVAREALALGLSAPAASPAWRVPLAAALLERGDAAAALAELEAARDLAGPSAAVADLWTGLALLELGRPAVEPLRRAARAMADADEVVLAPIAAIALTVAEAPSAVCAAVATLPDPDAPAALARYVDRRASAGRVEAELAARSLRRTAGNAA